MSQEIGSSEILTPLFIQQIQNVIDSNKDPNAVNEGDINLIWVYIG